MIAREMPARIEAGGWTFDRWIPNDVIRQRTAAMAGSLAMRFDGQRVRILPILRGAKEFSDMLQDELGKLGYGPEITSVDPIKVKSYQGTESRELKWEVEPKGKGEAGVHDIILEDIADTARTLTTVEAYLLGQNPASLTTVVLLNRPEARANDPERRLYQPGMVGFEINNPDAWAIGFGLDLDETLRDLPDIYGRVSEPHPTLPAYTIPQLPGTVPALR